MKYLLIFLSLSVFASAQFADAPSYKPYNLGFENSVEGSMPIQWSLATKSKQEGFEAEATTENPYNGKYSLTIELHKDTADGSGRAAAALHKFDATPYRGKTIKLTAMIRAEITGDGFAGFYVAEQTTNNQYPFINNNEDDPIVFNTWEEYTVTHTVTPKAFSLSIGLYLQGNGKAWMDEVKIEVVGVEENPIATKTIDQELANDLYLFSEAYGVTKFFHPSDEIANMNTDTYLYNSIDQIENASNSKEVIEKRITRIAPSAKLFENKKSAEKYSVRKPLDATDRVAVAKLTNSIFEEDGNLRYGTKRLNIYDTRLKREAAIYQIINAKPLLGKKLKYSTMAKVIGYGLDANAELWFRIDFGEKGREPMNLRHHELITSGSWKKYTMDIEIPEDADQIRVGLVFFGEGRAWFDEVEISEEKKGMTMEYKPKNFTFNNKWQPNKIEYWRIPKSSISTGYTFGIDTSEESYDGASLMINTDEQKYVELPDEAEVCSYKISENMWLALPLTVFDNSFSTLPVSNAEPENQITLHPNDYRTKIAAFTEMWNYMKHYSSLILSNLEWENLYKKYVVLAANTSTVRQYEAMLNDFLKITNNVRAEAWRTSEANDYTLPFIVNIEGDRVVVIRSNNENVLVGDKIVSIDNVELTSYLEAEANKYAGKNEVWRKKKVYFELAEGDFKEKSVITVERQGKEMEVEIERNERVRDMQLRRPGTLEWIDDEIMYIDGTRLNDFEMMELMPQFESAKGLIIDLRGDALLSEHVLGFFVNEDFPSYNWTLRTYTNPCEPPIENTLEGYVIAKESGLSNNVVFISGETTVGKAETILRLVKSNRIGKIIGEETVGSYDVVNSIKLPEFYNFSMGIYPISYDGDSEIKFKPIKPDVEVTAKGDFPNDPKINKAIEMLKGK